MSLKLIKIYGVKLWEEKQMSHNILRFKKGNEYVPVDVNAENVLLKNKDGEYTGENLEDVLRGYHNLEQNYTPRLSVLETEVEVERQRINAITKLAEGSTTADAELIDIRTGADGTVYETAGEAVRNVLTAYMTVENEEWVI